MKQLKIYTAGISIGQHGVSGYGVLLLDCEQKTEIAQSFQQSTSNRMQLLACIEGLKTLKEQCNVRLFSTSEYIVNSINCNWVSKWKENGWRNSSGDYIQNIDLWEQLLLILENQKVDFVWIRKTDRNLNVELCNSLAKSAINNKEQIVDGGYLLKDKKPYKSKYYEHVRKKDRYIYEQYGYDNAEDFVIDAAYDGEVEAYILSNL